MNAPAKPRLVVGITGASGAIYGIRLLERLRELDVETHLVVTSWARVTIEHETGYTLAQAKALADVT
jgi:flavin prenyltransferase